jgi:Kef-type K+ transport system membrane component KefB
MTSLIENPVEDALALFLIQVVIILVLVRALGKVLAMIKQPMVVGEIIAGKFFLM